MDNAGDNIRGFLTRWLLEIKPGCFVGNVTTAVRDQLWEGIIRENQDYFTGAVMIYNTDTEQGFAIKMINNQNKVIIC